MSRYNKLKLRALSVFAGGEWPTPGKVAQRLDFSPRRAAWTYCKRLWRFGLLGRRSPGRGELEYRITENGAARLRWLRSERG